MSINLSNAVLPDLIASIKGALDHENFFTVNPDASVTREENLSAQDAYTKIDSLASSILDLLKSKDLRQIDLSEKESLRDLVDVAYRTSKVFKKQFGKAEPTLSTELHKTVLCAKLGGRINKSSLTKDFIDFIEVNALQHKIQALGYQLGEEPALPIEGIDKSVLWSEITKDLLVQDPPNKAPAFSFSFEGKELFRSDATFKLHSDYTYIDGKIAKYNPIASTEARAYDYEKAAPGLFKIELWTAIKDVAGERPVVTIGDHAYLVLVDERGARVGVGQYGMAEDFHFTDLFSIFGKKKGGVETPDRYLLMPKDSHSFQKTEFTLNKDSFDTVLNKIKDHKADENFSASLLCGNCSSMVEDLLGSINIKINPKIHCLELFWRKFAPLSFITAVDKMLGTWPSSATQILSYLPLFYIPIVLYGLATKLLSWNKFNDEPSDISLFDVFFFPWKVTIDHPFAIRRWQKANSNFIDVTQP